MTSPLPPRRRDTRDSDDLIRQDRTRLDQIDHGLVGGRYSPARPLKPRGLGDGDEDDFEDPSIIFINTDRMTYSGSGPVKLRLTHTPYDGSEHVRWGTLTVPTSAWVRGGEAGNVVTIYCPWAKAGDEFSCSYATDDSLEDPPLDFVTEVTADSPIFWADHNESAGTTLVDRSGFGRNGSYQGAVSLGHAALAAGLPGTSVAFNGTGWAQVSAASWQSPPRFTAETWVQFDAVGSVMYLFGVDNAGALGLDRSWALAGTGVGGAGEAHVIIPSGATYVSQQAGDSNAFTAGLPYQVLMTYDGAILDFYLNGRLVDTASGPLPMNAANVHPLTIGASSGTVFGGEYGIVQGRQQHSILFDHVLDADRVLAHYLAGVNG